MVHVQYFGTTLNLLNTFYPIQKWLSGMSYNTSCKVLFETITKTKPGINPKRKVQNRDMFAFIRYIVLHSWIGYVTESNTFDPLGRTLEFQKVTPD